jgi:hypothetical protein
MPEQDPIPPPELIEFPAVPDPDHAEDSTDLVEDASYATTAVATEHAADIVAPVAIEEQPMLEVHAPHKSIHTWRDFFIHIATIVIGLLIAIGLEQTVEYIHHRHQAHDLQDSLVQESLTNRDVVKTDIASIDSAIEAVEAEVADLDHATVSAAKPAFVYTPHPKNFYLLPISNTAWLTVRDGGSLSLLSSQIVDDYWHTDYYGTESTALLQDLYKEMYENSALIHIHKDMSVRSPEEKGQLLQSLTRLIGDFSHLRSTLLSFDEANDIAISGDRFTEKKMKELSQQEPAPPLN